MMIFKLLASVYYTSIKQNIRNVEQTRRKKGTIQCTTQNGMLLMRLQINVPRQSYSRFWTRATSRLTYYSPRSFSRHSFDPSAFTPSFILMDEPFVGSVNASFNRRRWISWSTFYFHRFGWQRKKNYEDCPFHNSLQALILWILELEWSA